MSWKMTILSVVATVALASVAAPAMGGIEVPPPWQSQGITGNETHWRWDFFPPSPPITTSPLDPVGHGAPGTPPPTINGGQWLPTAPPQTDPTGGTIPGGGDGVYCIQPGGTITITMPNWPQPNDFKLIFIQFHFFGGAVPVAGASAIGPAGTPVSAINWGPTYTISPGPGGGSIGAAGLCFPFNPDFELITISNPSPNTFMYLEWLTIDTICAPSPGAAAMLGLGTLLAAGRRRR